MTSMTHTRRRCIQAPIALLVVGAIGSGSLATDAEYVLANSIANINALTVPSTFYTGQHDIMSGGVSVGDFNNDGWPDIYLPGLGTAADMLFINQGDGTFVDEAAAWGLDRVHMGQGSAVGDVNGDGLADLYVISFGPGGVQARPGHNLLYINNGPDASGQWSFSEEAKQRGVETIVNLVGGKGAAFGDIDLDGDLDLIAGVWQFTPGMQPTRLYENDGSGHFTDITDGALPDIGYAMRVFTPKFIDVNGDRYPDLLMTNDFGSSTLFINNGPDDEGRISYRDVTEAAGITTDHNGMGSAVNDFNGDGLLDWFQTNIYVSSASYYNTLFMCDRIEPDGTPVYIDQAVSRGVQDVGWGWGVVSGDYDNDGDVDMVATSGWPQWPSEQTRLWKNDGSGFFNDTSFISGLSFNINGRGLVQLDYDRDGDLDLAFVDNGGPFRLYRNDLGLDGRPNTHYLRLDLNTDLHPCLAPMGYGTRVIATYGGRDHLRVIDGASSYLGQSELTVHYGLMDSEQVERVRIEWADGSVTIIEDPTIDQQSVVYAYHPADMDRDGRFTFFDVSRMLTAYIAQSSDADFNDNGSVDIMDIMAFLERFNTPCE